MTAPDQPVLTYIAYDRFVADVEAIAVRLEQDAWKPDFIVGVGRGGLVPGTFLSHRTGIPMLSVDYSAKVEGFSDDLLVKLAAMTVAGQRILFVDDINDSGATLIYLRDAILRHGGVDANRKVAVLINNLRSRTTADHCSRTIDRAVDKDWHVFPWESVAPDATLVAESQEVPERLA